MTSNLINTNFYPVRSSVYAHSEACIFKIMALFCCLILEEVILSRVDDLRPINASENSATAACREVYLDSDPRDPGTPSSRPSLHHELSDDTAAYRATIHPHYMRV